MLTVGTGELREVNRHKRLSSIVDVLRQANNLDNPSYLGYRESIIRTEQALEGTISSDSMPTTVEQPPVKPKHIPYFKAHPQAGPGKSKQLTEQSFIRKSHAEKRKVVEESWQLAAFKGVNQALEALRSKSKKSGEIAQVVTSAAIAKDKAFPADQGEFAIKIPSRLLETMQIAIAIRPVDTSKQTIVVDNHSQSLTNTAPAAEIITRVDVPIGTSDNG